MDRFGRAGAKFRFCGNGSFPIVGSKQVAYICFGRELNIISRLDHIKAVESGDKVFMDKRGIFLAGQFKGKTNGIINVSGDGRVRCGAGSIYVAFVGSRCKPKFGKDSGDVLLPKVGSFWVALEGMENGEYLLVSKSDLEAVLVPTGKGIVYAQKCGYFWSRRMRKCILGIAAIDQKILAAERAQKRRNKGCLMQEAYVLAIS
jgi:hypothetical protein